jgi:hypothetical protein
MSNPYAAIPEEGLNITSEIPGVEPGYYERMFKEIDFIGKKDAATDPEYARARYVIANYVYLIDERLRKNIVREIDYDQLRSWAHENREVALSLLSKIEKFPQAAFIRWIMPQTGLLRGSMYSRSNQFNKNIYH